MGEGRGYALEAGAGIHVHLPARTERLGAIVPGGEVARDCVEELLEVQPSSMLGLHVLKHAVKALQVLLAQCEDDIDCAPHAGAESPPRRRKFYRAEKGPLCRTKGPRERGRERKCRNLVGGAFRCAGSTDPAPACRALRHNLLI